MKQRDTLAQDTLALIAHDGRKADLIAWATYNRERLSGFDLVATATTGTLLRDKVGLKVESVLSGPMGGDAQIAAMVAEGRIRVHVPQEVVHEEDHQDVAHPIEAEALADLVADDEGDLWREAIGGRGGGLGHAGRLGGTVGLQ